MAPSIRANLGYLGAENYFDLFVVAGNLPPFSVYYRTGGNLYDSVRGGGIEVREVHVSERLELAGQVDGWYDSLAQSLGGNVEEKMSYRVSHHLGITEARLQDRRRADGKAGRRRCLRVRRAAGHPSRGSGVDTVDERTAVEVAVQGDIRSSSKRALRTGSGIRPRGECREVTPQPRLLASIGKWLSEQGTVVATIARWLASIDE